MRLISAEGKLIDTSPAQKPKIRRNALCATLALTVRT
jgi:hypothetical protein